MAATKVDLEELYDATITLGAVMVRKLCARGVPYPEAMELATIARRAVAQNVASEITHTTRPKQATTPRE